MRISDWSSDVCSSDLLIRFTGLVIDTQGKVKTLLSRKDKRPERPDFKQDAKGKTLIPGLIDAHGHVMGLGFSLMTLDLSETTSLADAQAAIRRYAADNPEVPWIIGRGWNQEKWGPGRFPTAAAIAAVVADRPVWLERSEEHTSELQSLMRISYAVFCLEKKRQ